MTTRKNGRETTAPLRKAEEPYGTCVTHSASELAADREELLARQADSPCLPAPETGCMPSTTPRYIFCLLAEDRAGDTAAMIDILSQASGAEVRVAYLRDLESLRGKLHIDADTIVLTDSNLLRAESAVLDEFLLTPAATMILLDDWPDPDVLTDYLLQGASGCMLKFSPFSFVQRAIRAVSSGELWFPRQTLSDATRKLRERRDESADPNRDTSGHPAGCTRVAPLTERERAIVALLRAGLTNKEIGKTLGISDETVKKHLGKVFRQFGVRNRTQLALEASPTSTCARGSDHNQPQPTD